MRPDYTTSLYHTNSSHYNPWKLDVEVNGTDGLQFHPLIEDEETLYVFVPALSRTVQFKFAARVKHDHLNSTDYSLGCCAEVAVHRFPLDDA